MDSAEIAKSFLFPLPSPHSSQTISTTINQSSENFIHLQNNKPKQGDKL